MAPVMQYTDERLLDRSTRIWLGRVSGHFMKTMVILLSIGLVLSSNNLSCKYRWATNNCGDWGT